MPERYRELSVPTERLRSPAARDRGRAIYLDRCALCHGAGADGHGPRRTGLSAPPAAFTSAAWRERVTPRRAFYVIREGMPGSSMPAWPALSEQQTWDVVAYILSVAKQGP